MSRQYTLPKNIYVLTEGNDILRDKYYALFGNPDIFSIKFEALLELLYALFAVREALFTIRDALSEVLYALF